MKHPFLKRDMKIERFQGQQWIGGIDSLESSVEMTSKGRVAEFALRCKGPYRKSLDSDKNFKPYYTFFVTILRFVAIYALFWLFWAEKIFLGQQQCFFVHEVHYCMIYLALYTELNL